MVVGQVWYEPCVVYQKQCCVEAKKHPEMSRGSSRSARRFLCGTEEELNQERTHLPDSIIRFEQNVSAARVTSPLLRPCKNVLTDPKKYLPYPCKDHPQCPGISGITLSLNLERSLLESAV